MPLEHKNNLKAEYKQRCAMHRERCVIFVGFSASETMPCCRMLQPSIPVDRELSVKAFPGAVKPSSKRFVLFSDLCVPRKCSADVTLSQ